MPLNSSSKLRPLFLLLLLVPLLHVLLLTFPSSSAAANPYTPTQVCPKSRRYGKGPSKKCMTGPVDPNLKPRVRLEKWFTRKMWEDLFPVANQGWGEHPCLPYSYDSFVIAARYFPHFGGELRSRSLANSPYTLHQLQRRDVAAFFAHVLAESGLNNVRIYNQSNLSPRAASECFYRGGFYHFYEGGPRSYLFGKRPEGDTFRDGESCREEGRYCRSSPELDFWYPCKSSDNSIAGNEGVNSTDTFEGCYFGRGPLQLSWNYNYGQFQHFLRTENVDVDLLNRPNQLINRLDPPLAMLSALWFYMTPQPPKPSMHEIMVGNWVPSERNRHAGFNGSVFGPTSMVINNECSGEDASDAGGLFPGQGGENRRIKAFKWFCAKLGVNPGPAKSLSCKDMAEGFEGMAPRGLSWQPDWANMWRQKPCDCVPASFAGILPYFDPKRHPGRRWAKENERNRLRCVYALYKKPDLHRMDKENSPCLQHPVRIKLTRFGLD